MLQAARLRSVSEGREPEQETPTEGSSERLVDIDPVVLEGSDDVLREPAPPLDPYTPEPGARPGERKAFRVMWLAVAVLAILVAIVVVAAVR